MTATRLGAFNGVKSFLKDNNIERDEEIELAMLALVSGVDTLFLGEPGVGKTHLIELLTEHCIADARLFTHLLAKDQSADEVLGPRDIMAMKAGKIARITDGFLPTAHFAYLDEMFKASAPMLNPLLDLVANRVLKVGGQAHDCSQLLTIFASSNELPEREDLQAFRDRIGITKLVAPVATDQGLLRVTDLQLDQQVNGVDTSKLTPLTLDDIRAIRDEIRQVNVGPKMRELMVKAQTLWSGNGPHSMSNPPSQRRVGQMWKVIKAHAWSKGRGDVLGDDFMVAEHMAWSDPEDMDEARAVVVEFASAHIRKAQRARDALDPIRAAAEQLKAKLDAATTDDERDELTGEGFKLIRQIRKLKKDIGKQVHDAAAADEDTEALSIVAEEIDSLDRWAERAVTGDD